MKRHNKLMKKEKKKNHNKNKGHKNYVDTTRSEMSEEEEAEEEEHEEVEVVEGQCHDLNNRVALVKSEEERINNQQHEKNEPPSEQPSRPTSLVTPIMNQGNVAQPLTQAQAQKQYVPSQQLFQLLGVVNHSPTTMMTPNSVVAGTSSVHHRIDYAPPPTFVGSNTSTPLLYPSHSPMLSAPMVHLVHPPSPLLPAQPAQPFVVGLGTLHHMYAHTSLVQSPLVRQQMPLSPTHHHPHPTTMGRYY